MNRRAALQREVGSCVQGCLASFPMDDRTDIGWSEFEMMGVSVVGALKRRFVFKARPMELAFAAGIDTQLFFGIGHDRLPGSLAEVLRLSKDEDGRFRASVGARSVAEWLSMEFEVERIGA